MVRTAYSEEEGYYVTRPNGHTDHYYIDTSVDPWLPEKKKPVLLIQHGCARGGAFSYHWVPLLARKYIVIRRYTRGLGKSSYPKRTSPWSDAKGKYENFEYNIYTIVLRLSISWTSWEFKRCISWESRLRANWAMP